MTPKTAWEAIQHFIPKDQKIWEPFYGNGSSGSYLQELGFNVVHKDVDFFEHCYGDIIITNPPFSKCKEILKRLKKINKPFIMIMPVSKLNTSYFRDTFKGDIQLIIPKKRIQFVKLVNGEVPQNYKSQCNFDCFYYCYKIGLEKDITWLN